MSSYMTTTTTGTTNLSSSEHPAAEANVVAVLSMLHERADVNSATRHFRGEPVLSWTLRRLCRSQRLGNIAILCWEDQLPDVEEIAEEHHAYVLAKGPRHSIASVDAVAAARRWADGWRGGLLSTCDFDLGFFAPWAQELVERLEAESILLVDPSAGLVDAALLDEVIEHAANRPHAEVVFTQAAPGLGGAFIRPALLKRLAASQSHPGRLLHYMPDQPMRDPIGIDACFAVPTSVARSSRSYRLDSDRQLGRIAAASISLNGTLATSSAQQIVNRVQFSSDADDLPREITIELNTNRRSNPTFWPGRHLAIARGETSIEAWRHLLNEAAVADDLRLTIGGVGDPLESDLLFPVIEAAREVGVRAIHVKTDLLSTDRSRIDALVDSAIDVVSVNLPAMSIETYAAVMGVDRMKAALENIAHFFKRRHARSTGVPLLVPIFTKTEANLAEMEAWYDRWLKALGCAVIEGPSDCAGQIPPLALADMSPTNRRSCARIALRMNVLSDGSIVACDEDVLGKNAIGRIGEMALGDVWSQRLRGLRADHRNGEYLKHPLCANCKEWHRK